MADGIKVKGEAELPLYLLMRAVSEMNGGKGRTALGTALTGTYSTLLNSKEGSALRKSLSEGQAQLYFEQLESLLDESESKRFRSGAEPRHLIYRAMVGKCQLPNSRRNDGCFFHITAPP